MNDTWSTTTTYEYEKSKKRHYIYLAGNIGSDDRTYEWREKFCRLIDDEPNVVVINPCANNFNQGMKSVEKGNIKFVREVQKRSQKILRAKDYQLIKICSVVVVNLELYTPEKPLVGTIQELTWAHDIFYTPVLAICGKKPNIYTEHPWIEECCSAQTSSIEEVVGLIKTFFLAY